MLDIQYVAPPDNASCALACHAMTARYFFPDTTVDEICRILEWRPGYATWAFQFWSWAMERGVAVADTDAIDYPAWATDGIEGLRRSVSPEEFAFYQKGSSDLDALAGDIRSVLADPLFSYRRGRPRFDELANACRRGDVCEVVLDAGTLDGTDTLSLHRVVVLDADDERVVYHDPRPVPFFGAMRIAPTNRFVAAWLERLDSPELCVYSTTTNTRCW